MATMKACSLSNMHHTPGAGRTGDGESTVALAGAADGIIAQKRRHQETMSFSPFLLADIDFVYSLVGIW